MAESSNPPFATPISVISPKYCTPDPIDLAILRNPKTLGNGNFAVFTEVNGNTIFKAKEIQRTFHKQMLIVDAAGDPIVRLRRKILTLHNRREVYRGQSTDSKDLLFTAKIRSITSVEPKLHVFLANNTAEKVCDFELKGGFVAESCVVYAGDHEGSGTIVAQMRKKHTAQSISQGKDDFMVTVNPNIDYAFIVALIVIIDDIGREDHPTPMHPPPVHQAQPPSQQPQRPCPPPYPTQQPSQDPFGRHGDANRVLEISLKVAVNAAAANDDYAKDDDKRIFDVV